MTVAPIAIAVTTPVADTVATPAFDDCQVAVLVMSVDAVADDFSNAVSCRL